MTETNLECARRGTLTVAVIGCGAIGRTVLRRIPQLFGPRVRVTAVLGRRPGCLSDEPDLAARYAVVTSLDQLLSDTPDLVVECASHEAVRQYGSAVLASGRDFMMVSTGVLADDELRSILVRAASDNGTQLRVVPGAIGASDVLDAMRCGGLSSVRYTGRKPPPAWRGSAAERLLDLSSLTEATAFFRGSAREAAKTYPKNANVAATIALAGVGFDRTEVVLIADPACATNQHVIEAGGECGSFHFSINAAPSANPRSSAIVGDSVCHAIGGLVEPIVIL